MRLRAIRRRRRSEVRRWTDRSNRLGVSSPAMGRASQGILVGLDLAMVATIASNIDDGRRYGFTWKRVAPTGHAR